GLVALEAMLAAKPVVGANHGGLKEILVNKETGILFEPNNREDLIHSLEELIVNEDKRIALGRQGFQRAITEFSLDNYVTKIQEVCLKQIPYTQTVN
ncbi:MAG TPA: glycosyltransferase family 4 protein, partial [Flavobacterium sp.]|uniref:glycosyltransferase n=1 Tax=Flavobacterium sp. TaxID=239 RepID=UPI002D109386